MDNNNSNNSNNENGGAVNKKAIAAIVAVLVLALVIWGIVAATSKNKGNNDSDKGVNNGGVQQTWQAQQPEESLRPDAKPVFKFFYAASDEKAAELMTVIEELKQTYGDRVEFDISDIDEHPEYVEQFSVISPPQLYMLAKNGDFADIKMGVYDKAEFEDAINKTLD